MDGFQELNIRKSSNNKGFARIRGLPWEVVSFLSMGAFKQRPESLVPGGSRTDACLRWVHWMASEAAEGTGFPRCPEA